jgi:hypothetical protein
MLSVFNAVINIVTVRFVSSNHRNETRAVEAASGDWTYLMRNKLNLLKVEFSYMQLLNNWHKLASDRSAIAYGWAVCHD